MKLKGKVGVITGASRGAGAGIAKVLGEHGMTVYVTGRTTRNTKSPDGLGGCIEEVAEEVTRRGGRGIAVRVDWEKDADAAALAAKVKAEHGKLDLLVANAWRGYEFHDGAGFVRPFWEQPTDRWERMIDGGAKMSLRAARALAPQILTGKGVIVTTTVVATHFYCGALVYDLAKNLAVRMAYGMGKELAPHGAMAMSLGLGFLRTERTLPHLSEEELAHTESPEYAGRTLAAMLADPYRSRFNTKAIRTGELAQIYNVHDIDGRQPAPFELPG